MDNTEGFIGAKVPPPPPNVTPEMLVGMIQKLNDELSRTIILHPLNEAPFREWLETYEYKQYITILVNHYVPVDQIVIIPSAIIQKPTWM